MHGFRNELKFDFPTCEKLGVGSAFEDQHRFDADPDPDPNWHENDADLQIWD